MSLDKVFETLENESNTLCKGLIEKARMDAHPIVARAEKDAQDLKRFYIARMDTRLKGDAARIQIEEDLQRRKINTKAKDEFILKVYSDVEKHLNNVRSDQDSYKKIFKNLLTESLGQVKGDDIVLDVDQRDRELALDSLKELNLNCQVTSAKNYSGGLSLSAGMNRISVSNTFESRLEKSRKVLRASLNEVLFSEG